MRMHSNAIGMHSHAIFPPSRFPTFPNFPPCECIRMRMHSHANAFPCECIRMRMHSNGGKWERWGNGKVGKHMRMHSNRIRMHSHANAFACECIRMRMRSHAIGMHSHMIVPPSHVPTFPISHLSNA